MFFRVDHFADDAIGERDDVRDVAEHEEADVVGAFARVLRDPERLSLPHVDETQLDLEFGDSAGAACGVDERENGSAKEERSSDLLPQPRQTIRPDPSERRDARGECGCAKRRRLDDLEVARRGEAQRHDVGDDAAGFRE